MKNFTKVFSFILTLPLIIFFSIFTISNLNITYLSFWPLEQKLIMPIWALSITFFFSWFNSWMCHYEIDLY